jgi:hypothetical protein
MALTSGTHLGLYGTMFTDGMMKSLGWQVGGVMKLTRVFASLLLLAFGLFVRPPSAPAQSARSDSSEAVLQLENRFHEAFLAGDTKTFDVLLASDFVWMHGTGDVWTKGMLIEQFRSGKANYKEDRIDSVKVTMYKSTAVVVGHDVRRSATGDLFDFNYTTTYVKQNGEWRVALFHTSYCPCAGQQTTPKLP